MSWFDMSPAEIKREIKQDAAREAWDAYGPKCATCIHGRTFDAKDYPYALSNDVVFCLEWHDLMVDPYESNEEIQECWEG